MFLEPVRFRLGATRAVAWRRSGQTNQSLSALGASTHLSPSMSRGSVAFALLCLVAAAQCAPVAFNQLTEWTDPTVETFIWSNASIWDSGVPSTTSDVTVGECGYTEFAQCNFDLSTPTSPPKIIDIGSFLIVSVSFLRLSSVFLCGVVFYA